ncbi:TPA: aspartate-semialdehyde dehydrogenase [bacterium]|jgi:aspartate-semialdehyde dehydrogenase|nr:aspartate-semialdehyde dehydrogenase [bacterium]
MSVKKKYKVAVVGSTGLVGREIIRWLNKLSFPFETIIPLASKRSANKVIMIDGKDYLVKELKEDSFEGVDIALFSAGSAVSREYVPIAKKSGCIVIDNTSYFRQNDDVPLIAYGVNDEEVKNHKGIIANPNCSTIQMVVALKPIHDEYKIKKVVVSTYQSVSGAGILALDELNNQAHDLNTPPKVLPYAAGKKFYPIAYNLLPQIDNFNNETLYTLEEHKMINETHKILSPSIEVIPTCVRVPVKRGHSESLYIECEKEIDIDKARQLLSKMPNVIIQDDLNEQKYPQPIECEDQDYIYIGRIRPALNNKKALCMWVVADNLLVGAATNAIKIAFRLLEYDLV